MINYGKITSITLNRYIIKNIFDDQSNNTYLIYNKC